MNHFKSLNARTQVRGRGGYMIEPLEFALDHRTKKTDACWEWIGCTTSYGYGHVTNAGKRYAAHRLAYELHRGPIPDGILVCHTCDNRKCVRPDHLFLGTHKDNASDSVAKGRHWSRKQTHCKRGHELTQGNTYIEKGRDGYVHRKCRICTLDRLKMRNQNKPGEQPQPLIARTRGALQ